MGLSLIPFATFHLCHCCCLWCFLQGTQRGEALCNSPLAQHCTKEEEDGSSSQDVTSALCLPSWSKTLFSACRSNSQTTATLVYTITFATSVKSVGVLNEDTSPFHVARFIQDCCACYASPSMCTSHLSKLLCLLGGSNSTESTSVWMGKPAQGVTKQDRDKMLCLRSTNGEI